MTNFVHLRVYSDYSLGSGSIKIKDLVKACVKYKFPAAALTDKNNLFGSLEYAMEAIKQGIQPIIGVDFYVDFGNKSYGSLLVIAKNDRGYKNLLELASIVYLERNENDQLCISFDDLIKLKAGLLILAANPIDSIERKHFDKNNGSDQIFTHLEQLKNGFDGSLYLELIRRDGETNADVSYEKLIIDYAYNHNIPLVATNYASFLNQDSHEAQDILSCITAGRYILEDNRTKLPQDFFLKSASEMQALFEDLPEALENTMNVARRCLVYSESRLPQLPSFFSEGMSEEQAIKLQAHEGLKLRLSEVSYAVDEDEYYKRLEFELSVINKMQFAGYFLIVSDFIKWSKNNDIPVGPGRGSGAGSIVAWVLQITDLDPIRFGLLFERFLNPDRVSMPDFDIDFCQDRREEVIEYVKNKYGSDRVAQIITFGKLQARAVLKDVGRVLQMSYGMIDKICKMVPNNPANPVTLAQAIELDKELKKSSEIDSEINKLLRISLQLEGLNRHVSTHAAGIVIADRPIIEIVPLYVDHSGKMPAAQYSMKYVEAAGLIKFDFLGLKTLTVISWTAKLLKAKGITIDVLKLPLDDQTTYKLLSDGLTTGVFQFESAGMKEAIKRLKPDSIEDLIALGSLYRPGPMDNIPSYIKRKHGYEQPVYMHPLLEPILRETYGIIVYQEQVMEIARSLAGYTLGNADLLRRAMGKKIRAEMEAQRENFINGCVANNITKKMANEIFALIEKFASYGFNKSHAAAYAIISYQTAYLKANYTVEFLIASIDSEIDDTDKIHLFIQEAKRFKIKVLLPDINKSQAMFTNENESIRFGLGAIKNVGVAAILKIIEERENGPFTDIFNFVERCGKGSLNRRMFENLVRSGALDCLDDNRNKLLNNIEILLKYSQRFNIEKEDNQCGLFDFSEPHFEHKPNLGSHEKFSLDENLKNEFEAFGFYLSSHPLETYAVKLSKIGVMESDKVEYISSARGVKIKLAGVITSRKVKSSARGKFAFIQLSDRSGLVEVSIFNEELLYKNDALLQVGQIIFLTATAKADKSGLRIMVESLEDINEAFKSVNSSLLISIRNAEAIEKVSELVSSDGKPIALRLILENGSVVSFRSPSSSYSISLENESKLRKIPQISVTEY